MVVFPLPSVCLAMISSMCRAWAAALGALSVLACPFFDLLVSAPGAAASRALFAMRRGARHTGFHLHWEPMGKLCGELELWC